ncbi:MAG: iron-containing alcohol dehydrogenase [Solobacterium sp.]|nr:iron-containing alcohol dehydrogenase [Solobacterium sp.]MDY4494348.1 iron-containing alcohol dehydrogenase [Erysipelotrichaceae bacterium]
MNPFIYDIGTKVYFGKEELCHLGEEIKKYGNNLFMIYTGKNIIEDNGLYSLVYEESKKYGFNVVEFSKVTPNPRHSDVQEGIDLCREKGCDVILAIGGGSTMDSAKAISSGFYINAPIWDVVKGKYKVTKSLPIITIPTISATGSEMNIGAVISNLDTNEKISLRYPTQRPKASFLNPYYAMTVGKYQTACGTIDILCHTIETYFNDDEGMFMLDTFMEGLVSTVLKYGTIAYNEPTNYEARANLMWAAPWAINDFIRNDKSKTWTMHPIEHEISAFYDITHGLGLAILMPRYLRHIIDEKSLPRFRRLAVKSFGLDGSLSDKELALGVIKQIEDFAFNKLELESKLSNLGIDDTHFEEMASRLANDNGYFTAGYRKLSKDEIVAILKECL